MSWLERIHPQIHDVWRGRWPTGTVEPPRLLVDHELVVFARGRCEIVVGSTSRVMPAGTFVIIPPGMPHHTVVQEGPTERHCIHFDWAWSDRPVPPLLWSYLPERPPRDNLRQPPAWVPQGLIAGKVLDHDVVVSLMESVAVRWNAGGALNRGECRGLLLQVLVRLLSSESDRTAQPDRASALAGEVRQALELADVSRESIRDVLRSLGFSYEHLCRVFRQKYGIAPLAYVNRIRLERAKLLLQDPTLSMAEVARRAGYRDPAYFSRAFRQYTGHAPSRQHRPAHPGNPHSQAE